MAWSEKMVLLNQLSDITADPERDISEEPEREFQLLSSKPSTQKTTTNVIM